jgi:serine/threonine protein kinase
MTPQAPVTELKAFGSFQLLQKLGQGGMGSVFKALDENNRVVALKIASRMVASDAVLSRRFENEFTISSQLGHRHIVRALGYGTEGGLPYLVMEFMGGTSLSQRIKETGPLPLKEALAVFSQIAGAVGFIHKAQLVHRDIKPANILLDNRGRAKLGDLGLVKDLASSALLTRSQIGLGTLDYGAPEQFDDARSADFRSDIYALAASLYVALAGVPPFGLGTVMQILTRKTNHEMTPLSQHVPTISPSLDQLVRRALHPDPACRPGSTDEFLAEMLGESTAPAAAVAAKTPVPVFSLTDRRASERYAIRLFTRLETLPAAADDCRPCYVVDISATGLCLQTTWRIEPNSELLAYLPGESPGQQSPGEQSPGQQSPHRIRSRWSKSLHDQTWLTGCSFEVPLNEEELDRFRVDDLSRTAITRRSPGG